ncbi:MAG: hypothetical protein ABIS69_01685, partial [Sediminibacterium sp.]
MVFRRCLLVGFLFVILLNTTNGQSFTVDTYSNQLLFNIFKDQPDSTVRSFLRLYAPSLLDKKMIQDPGSSTGNKNQYTYEVHSFIFTSHPYFKSSFSNGKLELYCRRSHDEKSVQVYDVKLWFEFDTQQEAEMAQTRLIETFTPISTNQHFSSANGFMRAEFSDKKVTTGFNKIQFRLTADNLDRTRFKILFETT